MAWWDDVLKLLRDEFGADAPTGVQEPATAKQAEALLKRTSKEIINSKARAEAARRRLLRAQDDLQKLTQAPEQHASYRERLTTLAKSISHESELVEAFDSHIKRLSEIQEGVERTLHRFERDLQMARTAQTAAAAMHSIKPNQKPEKSDQSDKSDRQDKPANKSGESTQAPGFRHARNSKVMNELKRGPKK